MYGLRYGKQRVGRAYYKSLASRPWSISPWDCVVCEWRFGFFYHSVCPCEVFCCKNMYIHCTVFLKLFSPCEGLSMHMLSITHKSLASRSWFISPWDCVVWEWRFGFCFLTIQSVRVKFCVMKMKIYTFIILFLVWIIMLFLVWFIVLFFVWTYWVRVRVCICLYYWSPIHLWRLARDWSFLETVSFENEIFVLNCSVCPFVKVFAMKWYAFYYIFFAKLFNLCESLYIHVSLISYKLLAPRPWSISPWDCVVWEWKFFFLNW